MPACVQNKGLRDGDDNKARSLWKGLLCMQDIFERYCRKKLNLNKKLDSPYYPSLSVCLLDAVFSMDAGHFAVTAPIVERYVNTFMKGNKFAEGDGTKRVLQHIKFAGGVDNFSKIIFGKTWTPHRNSKVRNLQRLAQYLRRLGIDNEKDIRYFEFPELLDAAIGLVEGLGDPFSRYLFLLVGDDGQCISDRFVHRFIQDALGMM